MRMWAFLLQKKQKCVEYKRNREKRRQKYDKKRGEILFMTQQRTLRGLARQAKNRMKNGFWNECLDDLTALMEKAKAGEKEDEFYLKVKTLLTTEGEVSDAIGRLTDREYYNSLSYEEKQRYTLALSEKYLRALERFRRESEFELSAKKA